LSLSVSSFSQVINNKNKNRKQSTSNLATTHTTH